MSKAQSTAKWIALVRFEKAVMAIPSEIGSAKPFHSGVNCRISEMKTLFPEDPLKIADQGIPLRVNPRPM
jgi:hypothetical protein